MKHYGHYVDIVTGKEEIGVVTGDATAEELKEDMRK